jgi:putative nucleotidyltransferase with HDIG domain
MSEAGQFLTSLAQSLQTMGLYRVGHPARERAIDASYERLTLLQGVDPYAHFSFLGGDVVYRKRTLRELKDWDWGTKLANAGIQRIEFIGPVERDDYEGFLEDVLQRVGSPVIDTSLARQERGSNIRYGAVGVKGTGTAGGKFQDALTVAGIAYTLREEAETVRWMHGEVETRGQIPLLEAETVVRSLSVAMHSDREIVIPLVQLKEFDQYTTTHSLNVSVLTMALAEFLGLGARDVRAFGVAGLLHDLGKVRIPKEVLTKPGRLTDEEWEIMKRHPSDGARIIVESDRQLDLAAVVAYEHHIMLNGGGYPSMHFHRECHRASKLVHICDVYDALRTNRPYRDAWESEAALRFIESRVETDFDPELVKTFGDMMRSWDSRLAVVDEETALTTAVPSSVVEVLAVDDDDEGEIVINLREDDEGLAEAKTFVRLSETDAVGEDDDGPVYEIKLPETPGAAAASAGADDDDDVPVYEIKIPDAKRVSGEVASVPEPPTIVHLPPPGDDEDDLPVYELKVDEEEDA